MILYRKEKRIEVTKNFIIIDNNYHSLRQINNLDFKAVNKNYRIQSLIACLPTAVLVYFYPNIYTILALLIFMILLIPNKKIYLIYFNNMLIPKYHTTNKNEFYELKERILQEIKKY